MDSHDSVMDFKTEEHTDSTPPVSNNTDVLSHKRKNRSEAWNHFTPMPIAGMLKSAQCNHCGSLIKYNGGTTAMLAHLRRCSSNPDNVVNVTHGLSSSSMENGEATVNSSPSILKFDQEVSRMDLMKMFVAMELPFQKVEHPYLHRFIYGLQPKFKFPSRNTLTRDILKNWEVEKAKMKINLSKNYRRICITTDTWTSSQDSNYMCLTGHYIDNHWKLQNKILNFTEVTEYTGEIMAKTVKKCLNGWELSRVLSVTLDNASSNDVGIQHLKIWLLSQNGLVLNGEYLHTRCCAHILNLIVKDGLKEVDDSITRIRAAVRYVRRTPSRFQRFKKCIDHETIGYKGYVGRDCETRWNSTYLMLKAALKHNKTFTELEFRDRKYFNEMSKSQGVPLPDDWEHVELILSFLQIFHDATERISGSSYATSNIYMLEVFGVGRSIVNMCNSENEKVRSMALKMKIKYNKYWGKPDDLNMLLLIAMVLDPRCKVKLVVWMAARIYDSRDAEYLKIKLDSSLKSIFDEYSGREVSRLGSCVNLSGAFNAVNDPYHCSEFYESDECSTSETELQKYIQEEIEKRPPNFNVLEWWKMNSTRYPILASIAREVLAIPITSVASESAFSTAGRVVDDYRTSLTSTTVEALICSEDWLKGVVPSFLSIEDLDSIDRIEDELRSTSDAASCSATVSLVDN